MLSDELEALRVRVVEDFCGVMEFSAFTTLAYLLSTNHSKSMSPENEFVIGYSEFANSIGLVDKTVKPSELGDIFAFAKDNYFLALVHQHQVALFENAFFEIIRILLIDQPLRLPSKKQIEYSSIINSVSREEIIASLVDRELNELKYKSVVEWFAYLNKLASKCTISDENVGQIAEAKAARDLIVHNGGVVNQIYMKKAGQFARASLGESISVAGEYNRDNWQLFSSTILSAMDCHLQPRALDA